MPLAPIAIDPALVSACGLYCGACRSHRNGRCPGCHANVKAGWRKVRACNLERGTRTCAECTDHTDPMACRKFANPIAAVIGFVFDSDRAAGIQLIREQGRDGYAQALAAAGRPAPPRRGKRPAGA